MSDDISRQIYGDTWVEFLDRFNERPHLKANIEEAYHARSASTRLRLVRELEAWGILLPEDAQRLAEAVRPPARPRSDEHWNALVEAAVRLSQASWNPRNVPTRFDREVLP